MKPVTIIAPDGRRHQLTLAEYNDLVQSPDQLKGCQVQLSVERATADNTQRDCPNCGGIDTMDRGKCRMCGWPH